MNFSISFWNTRYSYLLNTFHQTVVGLVLEVELDILMKYRRFECRTLRPRPPRKISNNCLKNSAEFREFIWVSNATNFGVLNQEIFTFRSNTYMVSLYIRSYFYFIFKGRDRRTNESRGFAFINYQNRDDAQTAINKMNGYGYDHLILSVEWSENRKKENETTTDGKPAGFTSKFGSRR